MISAMAFLLALTLTISVLAGPAGAADPFPTDAHIDRALYPKAYGALANEHLMFPVDQSDWPVKIGQDRQLFVDDFLIASRKGVERQVHQVRKYKGNPIMGPEKPWEPRGCTFHMILRDPAMGTRKFRMWYAAHGSLTLPSGIGTRFPACYAESDDGIHWTKPELGLHPYKGSKANNIVIPGGNIWGIIHEPQEPDPNRRYKAVVWHQPQYVPREGYFLYTSPDGLRWKRETHEPVALSKHRQQPGIGDTSLFRWDIRLKKYICDTKILFREPGTMRCRGMMESDDLIHWSRPRMTIYPDGLDASDAQIYGHCGFVYESLWIGMMRVMHREYVENSYKQTTIELTASRDGRHWTRVGKRKEFIPLGKPDEWDPHYHDACTPPILVGDELWIYYRSVPLWDGEKKGHDKISRIGLATLRRDGFVSLNAGETPGVIVTRPLTFAGSKLFVNAKIAEGGYVKAELRSRPGEAVRSYTLGECQPAAGDATKTRITWAGRNTIEHVPAQSLRLAFELKNAKLYSFWIE